MSRRTITGLHRTSGRAAGSPKHHRGDHHVDVPPPADPSDPANPTVHTPQLHGPDYQWTRKIDGRTRTTLLTAEQLDRYRPWFDNAKSIRALTAELETLSLDIANTTENWA